MEGANGTSIKHQPSGLHVDGKDEREKSIKGEGSNETRVLGNQERNTVAIRNQICNQTCEKYIRTNLFGLC